MPGASLHWRRCLAWIGSHWQTVAATALAAVLLCWMIAWLPKAYIHWVQRESIREAAKAARKSEIYYPQALHDPSAIFKAVRWPLTHPAVGQWYYEGDHSEPVSWAGQEPDLPFTGQSGSMNYVVVLAVVQGADAKKGVSLSFVGQE
jgi:hypothetical protein